MKLPKCEQAANWQSEVCLTPTVPIRQREWMGTQVPMQVLSLVGSVMKVREWLSISQPHLIISNSSKPSEKGIIKTSESSEFTVEDKYSGFCFVYSCKRLFGSLDKETKQK